MVDIEKVDWNKVSGLNIGMFRFDNVCGLPIVWNSETKSVDVLVNGKVLLSYNQNQVTGVVYN